MTHSTATILPLDAIPSELRDPLLTSFNSTLRNFREGRWEPAELNAGKLCEVVYTILRGFVDGRYASSPKKPRNMRDACKAFEEADKTKFPRSVRIQIPRMLVVLYEVRNNRGVGHLGGDVDPNHMDAIVVVEMAKWILAELVRVFHDVDVNAATVAVESIIERQLPVVWRVGDKRRVLKADLSMKEKALILLYHEMGPVMEKDLVAWLDHSNASVFRRDVLRPTHRTRLIEYDQDAGTVEISPKGMRYVEENLPLAL